MSATYVAAIEEATEPYRTDAQFYESFMESQGILLR
jgi:hypothetical protein